MLASGFFFVVNGRDPKGLLILGDVAIVQVGRLWATRHVSLQQRVLVCMLVFLTKKVKSSTRLIVDKKNDKHKKSGLSTVLCYRRSFTLLNQIYSRFFLKIERYHQQTRSFKYPPFKNSPFMKAIDISSALLSSSFFFQFLLCLQRCVCYISCTLGFA